MKNHPKLFAQIGDFEILLTAVKFDDQNNLKLLEEIILPIKNSSAREISDLNNITDLIKKVFWKLNKR